MSPSGFAIAGIQGMTGLDFPGLVSALVFTQGCNFHCPYCHNAHLIPLRRTAPKLLSKPPDSDAGSAHTIGMPLQEALAFLKKRSGLLDGLVISGGEPTLQPGLAGFCRSVKELGYQVKLDTNGSRPDVLAALLEQGLLDYVALDCKTLPELYTPGLSAEPGAAAALWRSVRLLQDLGIAHEARTTCATPFVSEAVIDGLVPLLGDTPWFLQKANLSPAMREKGLGACSAEALDGLRERAARAGARVFVR